MWSNSHMRVIVTLYLLHTSLFWVGGPALQPVASGGFAECIHSATIVALKWKKAYARVEPAAYLFDDALIAEYLSLAAEDPIPDVFLAALSEVVRARGVAQIATDSGLCRESLYKALSAGAHPRFETINSVLARWA